jgi:RNA polymerase sigma-70 factor (ECF subfamily)
MKLEVQIIPVSDVARPKRFCQCLGWRLDDVAPLDGLRIVQFTPPGSGSSVTFGTGLTTAAPGSVEAGLIVSDIVAARHDVAGRGIDASELWHGPPFPPEARQLGPDPERTSCGSFFSFGDPDGNAWLVQELTTRLPGRIDAAGTAFGSTADLASALRRAEAAHVEHQRPTGGSHLFHRSDQDENWPAWYAEYMVAEQAGTDLRAWSGSWSHFSVDRHSPVYCRVRFDHPLINTITATAVAELIVSELATNAIQHGSTDLYRRPVPAPRSSARRPDGTPPDDDGAPSDDDLLRMHVEGDPDAFGALFRRHRDQLWAVAIRTLGDREEAADALQDAMVSALRRAGTFRGDSAVMTWLHRIVVNACLDRMRRRAARPASGGHDDDTLDTLAGSGRLSDPSRTTDTALDVRAALRRLVPEQHAALVLVDMLDYPIPDAAEALGVSQGTVKSRAARGRARLLPMLAHLRPGSDRRDRAAGLTSTRRTRPATPPRR